MTTKQQFKIGDKVVYPAHNSIGTIIAISEEEIVGHNVQLYKIKFQKDNMLLHVPVDAAAESGLRVLNSKKYIDEHIISVLKSPSDKKEEAWRTYSSEYESKLNSGDLTLVAEIVRDLCESNNLTYSKRNLYDAALDRLVSEVSSVYDLSYETVKKRLVMITKGIAGNIEDVGVPVDELSKEDAGIKEKEEII